MQLYGWAVVVVVVVVLLLSLATHTESGDVTRAELAKALGDDTLGIVERLSQYGVSQVGLWRPTKTVAIKQPPSNHLADTHGGWLTAG